MAEEDGRQTGQTGSGQQQSFTGADATSADRQDAASRFKDTAKEDARRMASSARQRAEAGADALKDEGVEGLRAFSRAVRRAGDELGNSQQAGPVVDLVRQAATSLENVSDSLAGKSTGDMLGMLRDFGRRNPGAFVAGSVLAGLALGRIAVIPSPSRTRAAGERDADLASRRDADPQTPLTPQPSPGAFGSF